MRSFANLVFATQNPKMQQALAWVPGKIGNREQFAG